MSRRSTSSAGAPTGRTRPRRPTQALSLREKLGWMVAFLVVGGGLLWVLWPVVSLLLGSVVLAWLLMPVVRRLQGERLSRPTAAGLLFVLGLLAVLVLALLVIPAVAIEIQELSGNVSGYLHRASEQIGPMAAWIEAKTGYAVPLELGALQAEVPGWIARLSPDARSSIQHFFSGLFTSSLGFVTGLINVLLLPLFTFYLMCDWERLGQGIGELVPPRHRPMVRRLATDINTRLAAFVRGQITVALILGVLYSLGLWFSGIDLAFVVGMTAGVLFIIPYLGPAVGLGMALALALLKYGVDRHLVFVLLTFGGVQGLESWVLTPKIVGDKVGLHPMVVMVALIAGGSLLGLWGMMFAIPTTATLAVLLGEALVIYRASALFRGSR